MLGFRISNQKKIQRFAVENPTPVFAIWNSQFVRCVDHEGDEGDNQGLIAPVLTSRLWTSRKSENRPPTLNLFLRIVICFFKSHLLSLASMLGGCKIEYGHLKVKGLWGQIKL